MTLRLSSAYLTALYLAAILSLAGCASTTQHSTETIHKPVSIGPFAAFSGRLIVIEPTRRWQVSLTWQAEKPDHGWLRITHAATATVVELRWQDQLMQIRDNQQPGWRDIGSEQLSKHGIVIPPRQLAAILLGQMPAHFKQNKPNHWASTASGSLIRLRWQKKANKLTMTDIKHGRKATLIIQP